MAFILRELYRRWRGRDEVGDYDRIRLSPEDMAQGSYKKFFGGGAAAWEKRGRFQLLLLQSLGLQPSHQLLDLGCGVLRGGRHLIGYLDHGHYQGIDANGDFICAADALVAQDPALAAKAPLLRHVEHFELAPVARPFDFALAFSVLNHCDEQDRKRFLRLLPTMLASGGRVVITHATWLGSLPTDALVIGRKFERSSDLPPDLQPTDWGWPGDEIFPIVELIRA